MTIDIHLQNILYNAIQKGQVESNSKSANGIILDPHTGEILAMAGSPSYDPNNYMKYNIEHFKKEGIYTVVSGSMPSFTCPNNMSIITGTKPIVIPTLIKK